MDKLALVVVLPPRKVSLSLLAVQPALIRGRHAHPSDLQHPPFPSGIASLGQGHNFLPQPLLVWVNHRKISASPDIISGFPPAFIKVICYVYYYYFLNPFNFKHSYSLPLPLGPLCCTGHGLERSARLRGQDKKDQSRCGKSTMNPACERRGARLAPK